MFLIKKGMKAHSFKWKLKTRNNLLSKNINLGKLKPSEILEFLLQSCFQLKFLIKKEKIWIKITSFLNTSSFLGRS
jgi:hypothetical protein